MAQQNISTIGIVGSGKMGKSLFNYLTKYNYSIIWICRSNHVENKNKYERKLARYKNSGALPNEEYEFKTANTIITDNHEQLTKCDIVIETITENTDYKNTLFDNIYPFLNPFCILTSNSSSIIPDNFNLMVNVKRRFAGLHFFFPAETNSIAELIPTKHTSKKTIKSLQVFCKSINKYVFTQNYKTAFFVNRFFLEIQAGLFNYCQKHNIGFDTADMLIKEHLFPVGIFEMMDEIGPETLLYSINNYKKQGATLNETKPLTNFLNQKPSRQLVVSSQSRVYSGAVGSRQLAVGSRQSAVEKQDCILKFVNNLFYKTAEHFIETQGITEDELLLIISEYTKSEYNPLYLQKS